MSPQEIVSFLSVAENYPRPVTDVTVKETHTAFIVLAGASAFKMKKPVRLPYLDFTTLDARKAVLEEELRVNRQLAGAVYKRVLPVTRQHDGRLKLNGDGVPVEWLLEMRRQPENRRFDNVLASRGLVKQDVETLGVQLCDFYGRTARSPSATVYLRHLRQETLINRDHLVAMGAFLFPDLFHSDLNRASELLELHASEIMQRGLAGMIVDGHGDLRTEHVFLTETPVIFDRLEFDAAMRQIDIYDEINYLGLECEMAGYGWIGSDLMAIVNSHFAAPPSDGLLKTLAAFRLLLKARLAIDHLYEPFPSRPGYWSEIARRYLRKASQIIATGDDG